MSATHSSITWDGRSRGTRGRQVSTRDRTAAPGARASPVKAAVLGHESLRRRPRKPEVRRQQGRLPGAPRQSTLPSSVPLGSMNSRTRQGPSTSGLPPHLARGNQNLKLHSLIQPAYVETSTRQAAFQRGSPLGGAKLTHRPAFAGREGASGLGRAVHAGAELGPSSSPAPLIGALPSRRLLGSSQALLGATVRCPIYKGPRAGRQEPYLFKQIGGGPQSALGNQGLLRPHPYSSGKRALALLPTGAVSIADHGTHCSPHRWP